MSETVKIPEKSQLNLEEIVYLANKVGMEYVEARREAERLNFFKSSEKAKAIEKYDNGERSEAKIKRLAEMDPEYLQFLDELANARAKSEKMRIRYDSYINLFEAKRSLLSYQKAEMKLL